MQRVRVYKIEQPMIGTWIVFQRPNKRRAVSGRVKSHVDGTAFLSSGEMFNYSQGDRLIYVGHRKPWQAYSLRERWVFPFKRLRQNWGFAWTRRPTLLRPNRWRSRWQRWLSRMRSA